MLVAASLGLAFHRQRLHEIETDLEDGRKLRLEHQFPEAVRVLEPGPARMAALPAAGYFASPSDRELRLARRGQKAAALHSLADLIRFRYGLDPPSGEKHRP